MATLKLAVDAKPSLENRTEEAVIQPEHSIRINPPASDNLTSSQDLEQVGSASSAQDEIVVKEEEPPSPDPSVRPTGPKPETGSCQSEVKLAADPTSILTRDFQPEVETATDPISVLKRNFEPEATLKPESPSKPEVITAADPIAILKRNFEPEVWVKPEAELAVEPVSILKRNSQPEVSVKQEVENLVHPVSILKHNSEPEVSVKPCLEVSGDHVSILKRNFEPEISLKLEIEAIVETVSILKRNSESEGSCPPEEDVCADPVSILKRNSEPEVLHPDSILKRMHSRGNSAESEPDVPQAILKRKTGRVPQMDADHSGDPRPILKKKSIVIDEPSISDPPVDRRPILKKRGSGSADEEPEPKPILKTSRRFVTFTQFPSSGSSRNYLVYHPACVARAI